VFANSDQKSVSFVAIAPGSTRLFGCPAVAVVSSVWTPETIL
jgi:hypothetical protein